MEKKILLRVKKFGRVSNKFPIKRSLVGAALKKGLPLQRIKIDLTSDGIEIYDKKGNQLKNILYGDINACIEVNAAEYLKINKGSLRYSSYNLNIIYLYCSNNEKIYLLFWSNLEGWQRKRHNKVLKIIQDNTKQPNLKDFLKNIAPNYDNYEIPISRVQEEFHLDINQIRHIIEGIKDPNLKFELSKDYIRVKEIPNIDVVTININEEEEIEVVDKIEVPLEFHIKNIGTFPAIIKMHLDAVNLPLGKEHPPFKIEPGKTAKKIINVSTHVKDNEYTIDMKLCDHEDNGIEIEGSGVKIKINKKTSKKMKLKNIIKQALFKSSNVLGLARNI